MPLTRSTFHDHHCSSLTALLSMQAVKRRLHTLDNGADHRNFHRLLCVVFHPVGINTICPIITFSEVQVKPGQQENVKNAVMASSAVFSCHLVKLWWEKHDLERTTIILWWKITRYGTNGNDLVKLRKSSRFHEDVGFLFGVCSSVSK